METSCRGPRKLSATGCHARRRQPQKGHAAALQRKAELTDALAALDRDIAAYQGSVDRLATLRLEHQRDEQERPSARISRSAPAGAVPAGGGAGARASYKSSSRPCSSGARTSASHRSELEAFARDDVAVTTRQQALGKRAAAQATAQTELNSWSDGTAMPGRRHAGPPDAGAGARSRHTRRDGPRRS